VTLTEVSVLYSTIDDAVKADAATGHRSVYTAIEAALTKTTRELFERAARRAVSSAPPSLKSMPATSIVRARASACFLMKSAARLGKPAQSR